MKKKLFSLLLATAMMASLVACGNDSGNQTSNNNNNTNNTNTGNSDETYEIGICQLVQHEALDAATQGFKDALTEEFGDKVSFDEQNAQNDSNTCATIVNSFVSKKVDLILGNATPALQAAANATANIPILGTSITEYGVALSLDNFHGTVGGNISGTSDLAPLDEQAEMIKEFCPDKKTVGILYCSAEPNSKYQADKVQEELEGLGYTVTIYTFTDTNDVSTVTTKCASENEIMYIPTDNAAASNTELIDSICSEKKIPVFAGEEGIAKGCGVATLSISYYDLGYTTGQMAVKVLKGEKDISQMAIEYAPAAKKYVASRCEALGLTVPEGYEAIEE